MVPPACSIFERAEADTVTPFTLNLRCTSPMPSSLMGWSGRRTNPAPNSVSGVTSAPSASWPRCRTFTTCAACLNGFVKPRFGMRRTRGIWPPSNPGRTLPPWRAVCPLPPRPAVLPIPEPGPRPLRMRARCDPGGLWRLDSVMCRRSRFAAFARRFAFGLALVFALAFGFAIAYSPAFAFAGVTSTRWRTWYSMPRSDGRSCFTTTAWWCFKPSASSVRRSNAGRPIPERTCRIRSSPLPGGGSGRSRPGFRLRYFRVGGSLAMGHFLARPVRDGLELDAALLGDAPRRREVLQRIQRGPHHVVRVGGAEALGEDVAHAGALEHRAHGSAGDDAGPRRGRLQKHAPGAVVTDDFVRDGRARERDLDQATAGGFDRLAHRLAHLVRLAGGDPDAPLPVAHGDERVEAEAPAALHDLRDAVDGDDVLDKPVALALALARVAPLPAPPPTPAAPAPATPSATSATTTPSTPAPTTATATATASATRSRGRAL